MGLFDFLKGKSAVDKPKAPPSGEALPTLMDLPPIDGSDLPSIDSAQSQNNESAPQPVEQQSAEPTSPDLNPDSGSKSAASLTVRLPPIDFSLPKMDEESSTPESFAPIEDRSTLQSLETPKLDDANTDSSENKGDYVDLSEDLNKLFLADDTWHEPDWDKFTPYPEPVIEPPKPADFAGHQEKAVNDSDLPSFDTMSEDVKNRPVDVFVRGKDYVKVYSELGKVNYLLDNQEPRILTLFEEVLSKEEDLLKKSKDTMEYVYKRLLVIDKRIFG